MGLDMYLYIRQSKYNTPHTKNKKVEALCSNELLKAFQKTRVTDEVVLPSAFVKIDVEVAYWRKVNAIHRWFVEKLADGLDECQEIYVSLKDLENLRETCEEVMMDHSKAEKLLSTQEGFFFGSTEYDDDFFEAIDDTIKQLTGVINFLKENEEKVEKWNTAFKKARDAGKDFKKKAPEIYSCFYQASW